MTQPTQQQAFGARLRQLRREKSAREERDVEQSEVAEAVGDAQPNVARWERGRIPKEDDTIRKLAAFYGVNFVWLRYGEGPKEPEPAAPPHPRATIGSRGIPVEDPRLKKKRKHGNDH